MKEEVINIEEEVIKPKHIDVGNIVMQDFNVNGIRFRRKVWKKIKNQ